MTHVSAEARARGQIIQLARCLQDQEGAPEKACYVTPGHRAG